MPSPGGQVSEMISLCLMGTNSAGERAGTRHLVDLPEVAITLRSEGKPGMVRSRTATGCPPTGA